MTPAWILDIFAAIMLAVAALSAARLAAARPWQRGAIVTDTDISHLLMGIAMAGMLASSLTTLANHAWAAVFGLLAAWFGYRVVRDYRASGARALAVGHCAPHLVHSAAMMYMFLAIRASAMTGGSGMSGMGGTSSSSGSAAPTLSVPTLAFAFALILIGYTVWDLDQFSGLWHGLTVAMAGARSPALAGVAAGAGGTEAATAAFARTGASGGAAADAPSRSAEAGRDTRHGTAGSGRARATGILASPGIVVGCRIAMGVTMALMLIIMI